MTKVQPIAAQRRPRRPGTVYVVVLGVALCVSVIGLSGLMVARLQLRRATQAQEWSEAGDLALSAIELGIARINASTTWRSDYTNNVEINPIAFGNGRLSFKLVDAALGIAGGDGNLNNNSYDPVRLHGIGRVGQTVRAYSVQLIGDVPLDVLRTTVAASGYMNALVPTTAKGGPLSCNGQYQRNATTYGNIEAGSTSGSGTVWGDITSPAAAKTMPDPTVFDAYKRLATPLTLGGSGGSYNLTANQLNSTINPFGGTLNPQGIYCADVPAGGQLTILVKHIKGTLVVDCQNGAIVRLQSAIFCEPNSSDLPILLIRHNGSSSVKDLINPPAGTVNDGVANYASQLKGLIHIIGGVAAQTSGNAECNLGEAATIQGTVILNQDVRFNTNVATFTWDPNLYLNPPVGYSTGPTVKIAPGSAQWEAGP